ncbi:hydrolase [Verrucomicrobiota bacterium]|nr:hydrolase [Verrucomicrobiota bacterium]
MRLLNLVLGVLALATVAARAEDTDPQLMQKRCKFESQLTKAASLGYLLYLPKDYQPADKARKWPLMLFLHGAGERGTDLAKVSAHGPPKLAKLKQDLPFIVVSPQCPSGRRWDNDTLLALLDDVIARHSVDTNRVYLTGLSMGGYGTWSLGLSHPERFAAIAPICGGGDLILGLLPDTKKQAALKTLPIWAFHGAKDNVVPPAESERMIAAVKNAGCKDVQLTIYPDAGHDSWTEAYNNPKLFEWFLAHERK